ncbi:S1 RNA-binding domain-containing protein [Carboxylicivirga sp. M1479]|uniref:CvfB family protein n=1 Tax=Carboxylicivirga sp. M1479 TaxID=2594476 RepID=UPI0011778450|nr:S1-like domain-containing RNA-binding protein [Carboxylicivirga sp. M1479]TRX66576.1 GntR family transcriptional regulator [Carboxylicivirga sp. M1479]
MIGKYNTLRVVKEVDFGVYLDGGEDFGEILLPIRYTPPGLKPEDEIEVFIYLDSEDRVIATTEEPYAQIGELAYLEAVSVNKTGAFLDWGLMKDLMVPFREQAERMVEGQKYVVYVYLDDESRRIVATSKLNSALDNLIPEYHERDEVELMVIDKTDLGYKVAINNTHTGMLYYNELFRPIKIGDKTTGYIKKVREDDKIDVALEKPGYGMKIDGLAGEILEQLKAKGGKLDISDKSPAEVIYKVFGTSKKNFKKAIGTLYKQRLIEIDKESIKLL